MDFTEEERKLIHELTQQPGWDLWMRYLDEHMHAITDFDVVTTLAAKGGIKSIEYLRGKVEFIKEILVLKSQLQVDAEMPESPLNPLED